MNRRPDKLSLHHYRLLWLEVRRWVDSMLHHKAKHVDLEAFLHTLDGMESRLVFDDPVKLEIPIKCNRCGEPMTEPGALYFGVPQDDMVVKKHICVKCAPDVEEQVRPQ